MAEYVPFEIPDDWSPRDVETKIIQLTGLLDFNTATIKARSDAFIDASNDHELAFARAVIEVDGPNAQERAARALIRTEDTFRKKQVADIALKSAKQAGHNIRQQLHSLDQ